MVAPCRVTPPPSARNDQRWDFLFRNEGDGRFAFDDLDNDGRVDVVVLNRDRIPTIIRNESTTDHHWIQIQLRGIQSNADGVGAQVKVVAGDLVQVDEVHSGRGFQSHFGSRLHSGLGLHDHIDRIEVRWIGGGVDVVQAVAADQCLTITQEREVKQ